MTYREAMQKADRAYWKQTLTEAGGSIDRAAKLANVHRSTAFRRAKAFGIHEPRRHVGNWARFGL